MTIKPENADDDIDALEALASEEKEFNKVSPPLLPATSPAADAFISV